MGYTGREVGQHVPVHSSISEGDTGRGRLATSSQCWVGHHTRPNREAITRKDPRVHTSSSWFTDCGP
jgi:hypothetical protein